MQVTLAFAGLLVSTAALAAPPSTSVSVSGAVGGALARVTRHSSVTAALTHSADTQ